MSLWNNVILALNTTGNGLFNILRDRSDNSMIYNQSNKGVKLIFWPLRLGWKRKSKLEDVDKDDFSQWVYKNADVIFGLKLNDKGVVQLRP